MYKRILFLLAITCLAVAVSPAAVQTFEEAKSVSDQSGKPILFEFVHEGCEHCEEAARHQETSEAVKQALTRVVHIILDVEIGEGIALSETYNVGIYYPVFILATKESEEIYRWIGYSSDENSFIWALDRALSDLTTIQDRISRQTENPTAQDATFLAKYYSDIGQPLEAVEYYRQASQINWRGDYSMPIFKNLAQACWEDRIPFDAVIPAADSVLAVKMRRPLNVIDVGRLMARLARAKGETDRIEKYLQAGLDITRGSENQRFVEARHDFMADYTLHVSGDTAKALQIKKASMGSGWQNDRDTFYNFSKWCLERKINLAESETYARKAINLVFPGKYRARVLNTVAEICDARGKAEEAVKLIRQAIEEEPDNEFYVDQLEKFLAKLRQQEG